MRKKTHQPDYFLLIVIGLLLIIGLVFLNSASMVMSYRNFGNPFHYLGHQLLVGVLPGLLFFILLFRLDKTVLEKFSNHIFFIGLILLVTVFLPGIGLRYGEAQRWINLGIFSFQPLEVFKLCLIIFLANFFSRREKEMSDSYRTTLPFIMILIVSILPIIFQRNFSAIVLIFGIAMAIYWVAGGRWTTVLGFFSLGIASMVTLVLLAPYRFNRIISFLNPQVGIRDISYHIHQASIAIGSGGIFGLGLGYSRQKFFYLPESFGDSIFAVIAEEVGFIFTSLIVILFFLLVWRALKIAKNTEESFPRLLVIGIAVWFGLQTIINIGGMLGVLPITGVPLPLISYGGSAMLANLAALGLLANVSKDAHIN